MRINIMSTRLVKESGINYKSDLRCTSPSSVESLLNEVYDMKNLDKEHMVMIMLDTKNKVMGINTVSIGTVNASLVSPREVFKMALLQGAVSVILSHNHPTGNPEPSNEDIQATNRLKQAGEILDIRVLDHIIIGDYYYSFKEEGLL